MIELFNRYKNLVDVKKALIVGQNMLNKFPGDLECFVAYFDYLISLAENEDNIIARTLLQQANSALAFFSDNVVIDESVLDIIIEKEAVIDRITNSLNKKREEQDRERIRNEVTYHNDAMNLLDKLIEKVSGCNNQTEFNKYINDMGKIDQSINRERLSKAQEERYEELTRKSSEIVSSKVSYFDNLNNREYNLRAIEAYQNVFNMFKRGNVTEDHKEIIKSLFAFDPSRLFNETLVYYNHVYNYVLSNLGDEDKFTITKYAIMSEKKR